MLASFSNAGELSAEVKRIARTLGFSRVGICRAGPTPQFERFRQWIAAGYAGEMRYLTERVDAYGDPSHVLPGVRSLVMMALDYRSESAQTSPASFPGGRVAQYALCQVDYHDLIHARLRSLLRQMSELCPGSISRGVVDSAPLHEREFARLAGLGWVGKNTLLIHPEAGSWCFLAAVLTEMELDPDPPFDRDHCGTCTACLQACPTQAFPEPYVLDATRCISYLTIELREAIPEGLRGAISPWVFGCDVCQDVCPWNRFSLPTTEPELWPRQITDPLNLRRAFYWTDDMFRRHFRHAPMWRTKRRGFLRNAALALGIQASRGCLAALLRGLTDHEPLVRGASAWSLGRIKNHSRVMQQLHRQWHRETDREVRVEISRALHSHRSGSTS